METRFKQARQQITRLEAVASETKLTMAPRLSKRCLKSSSSSISQKANKSRSRLEKNKSSIDTRKNSHRVDNEALVLIGRTFQYVTRKGERKNFLIQSYLPWNGWYRVQRCQKDGVALEESYKSKVLDLDTLPNIRWLDKEIYCDFNDNRTLKTSNTSPFITNAEAVDVTIDEEFATPKRKRTSDQPSSLLSPSPPPSLLQEPTESSKYKDDVFVSNPSSLSDFFHEERRIDAGLGRSKSKTKRQKQTSWAAAKGSMERKTNRNKESEKPNGWQSRHPIPKSPVVSDEDAFQSNKARMIESCRRVFPLDEGVKSIKDFTGYPLISQLPRRVSNTDKDNSNNNWSAAAATKEESSRLLSSRSTTPTPITAPTKKEEIGKYSKYLGVSRRKKGLKPWRAQCGRSSFRKYSGGTLHIGDYATEIEAAMAYDDAIRKRCPEVFLHLLNFSTPTEKKLMAESAQLPRVRDTPKPVTATTHTTTTTGSC